MEIHCDSCRLRTTCNFKEKYIQTIKILTKIDKTIPLIFDIELKCAKRDIRKDGRPRWGDVLDDSY